MRRTAALLVSLLMIASGAACSVTRDRSEHTDWAPAPETHGELRSLATSDSKGFRLHTKSGDKTFLPGVNLGSTTPLHQPGEVGGIDREHWKRWIGEIGTLGSRVVRIYTLLPPSFYEELDAWNQTHPDAPLYLVQGVYLPDESYTEPGKTLYDADVDRAFAAELRDVQKAVHGDLDREPTPGRSSGHYATDVSKWLAAWIIGVEWDPRGTVRTNRVKTRYTPGTYFAATDDASPTEQWLAGHMDDLASAEAKRGTSVPIAFVNWPTTDPLTHPTEPLASEDLVGVDATHVLPTDRWPGGTFASFHAYPYYPDFQRHEPSYERATWRGKPDRYAGYLEALRDHFAKHMPLLVTEYGVPSSLGSAHLGTPDSQGRTRDQGGHSEQEAMSMDADMMRMMADRGLGGAFVFAWVDEWFKRTWNTMEHQLPERRQLWHDPLTNEQWFGLRATDPDPIDAAAASDHVKITADASFVHLEMSGLPQRFTLDADVVPGPHPADYRVEIDRAADTAQVFVRRALDPIRLDTSERPYRPDESEPWHRFQLLTNRSYPGRSAEYQDVGRLVRGSWDPKDKDYDSTSTWQTSGDTVRLRLPWSMMGLADPSSRTALGEGNPAKLVTIRGIAFNVGEERVDFSWPTWNHTGHQERPKAGIEHVAEAMKQLAP